MELEISPFTIFSLLTANSIVLKHINKMDLTPDGKYLAAAGNPNIKFYDARGVNNSAVRFHLFQTLALLPFYLSNSHSDPH